MQRISMAACLAVLVALAATTAEAQDAAAGRQKAQMCAVCHGLDGIGRNPDVPNLAGDNAIYLRAQLHAFKSGERRHEQMSIIAQGLSEEDIADLTAWYSSLKITVEMPE
ncbi:c-type cytochrome [Lutibaculum baratangense]|uniref:Cytochrome c4 n=1 Tax=Lutibaculum baratangense AMV1 TaxID=631454 RepID=V4RNH9_9HYPH|nr:cytochrome c [Lutibaculum baratangense]ESR26829.1 Cytochrome c4 [Lutibaculum baratangense AMV1]